MSYLASAGRIDTHDIVEHRQVVHPWELILRQMSPGPFRGCIEYVQVNGILLYREHCTRRVVATGSTPPGYFVFGSPSSPRTRIDWCGEKIDPGLLAFARASTEIEVINPEASDHVALLVPEALLLEYLGEALGQVVSARAGRHLTCQARLGEALVRMIHGLIDEFPARGELLANDPVCKSIERQLLGTIVQIVGSGGFDTGRASPRKRHAAFLRAIEYGEDLRQPISVPRFAAASGVSPRVLELAFHQALDITPRKYLRWNRLNHARRQLLTAAADSTSVKEIATHWGFSEPGRFAVEYKQLFGESPSATLARNTPPPPRRLTEIMRRP